MAKALGAATVIQLKVPVQNSLLYDVAPVMMGIVELEGDCIRHVSDNQAASEYFGLSPGGTAGKDAAELGVPRETIAVWLRYYREAERTGRPQVFEFSSGLAGKTQHFQMTVKFLQTTPEGYSRHCYVIDDVTGLKQAYEGRAARVQQGEFATTFEEAAVGLAHVGLDGTFLRVNRRFCEITGYTASELMQMKFDDITYPEDRERDWKQTHSLVTGEIPTFSLEKRYICKSGEIRWVNLTSALLRDEEGRPLYFIRCIEDITERVAADQELQKEHQMLAAIFEHADVGLVLFDAVPPYRVAFSNRFYREVWPEPFRSRGIIGLPLGEYIRGVSEAWVADTFRHVIESRKALRVVNYPYDYMVGGRRFWNWTLEPVLQDGAVKYVALVMVEVTQEVRARERAEALAEEFRRSEQSVKELAESLKMERDKFEAVFRDAGVGLGVADARGNILELNREGLRIHGFDVDAKPPRGVEEYTRSFELYYPDGRIMPFREWPLMRAVRGEMVKDFDVRLVRPEKGISNYLSYSAAPIRNAAGAVSYLVFGITDLTERKKLEAERARLLDQAREALRVRDEFLSIASHELKTPVTTLKLHGEILTRTLKKTRESGPYIDKVRSMLDDTSRQVARLSRLIEDLLDVSRIQNGKLAFNYERVDVAQLIREVVHRFEPYLSDAHSSLMVHLEENIEACWDKGRVEQIVTNLLSNAIKYAPGTLTGIEARRTDSVVRIEVYDAGPGVPKEKQRAIFERFERGVEIGGTSGLGLGLFIVKNIAEGHGGEAWVESEPGGGSRFFVELPMEPDRKAVL